MLILIFVIFSLIQHVSEETGNLYRQFQTAGKIVDGTLTCDDHIPAENQQVKAEILE